MQKKSIPAKTLIETVQHSLRRAADATITSVYLSREAQRRHAGHVAHLLKAVKRAADAAKGTLANGTCPLFETGKASLTIDRTGALKVALKTGKRSQVSTKQAVALLAWWQFRNVARFAEV